MSEIYEFYTFITHKKNSFILSYNYLKEDEKIQFSKKI